MAETDRKTSDSGSDATPAQRSEELSAILQRIADHIAEVERRQGKPDTDAPPSSEAGTAGDFPDSELVATPGATDMAASQAPAASSPQAAETSDGDEPAAEPAPAMPTPRNAPGGAASQTRDERPVFTDDQVEPAPEPARRARTGEEPPALRSALPANAKPSDRSIRKRPPSDVAPASGNSGRPVDQSEAKPQSGSAGHGESSEAEAWDSQSVEALAQMYEAGEADTGPLRSMLELMGDQASEPTAAPARERMEGAALSRDPEEKMPAHGEVQRHELGEITRRIEAAIEKLAPIKSLDGLSERFQSLENRIMSALDALADKADSAPEGAAAGYLSSHIEELSSQLARTELKLSRLDDVEDRLSALAEKLGDDQIVALFGSLVPTQEELTQFAEDAANRSADRALEAYTQLHASQGVAFATGDEGGMPGASEFKSLSASLATFMDERRRSDTGTMDALETLQLAMQHVMDRVERLEASLSSADDGPTPILKAVEPARQWSADVREKSDELSLNPTRPRPSREPADNSKLGAGPAFAAGSAMPPAEPAATRQSEREFVEPSLAMPPAGPAPSPEPPVAPTAQPTLVDSPTAAETESRPSPANDRKALIELARKAADRARAENDPASSSSETRQAGGRREATTAKTATGDGEKLQVRPGILIVTSLAAVLLAGYWFVSGPKLAILGLGGKSVHRIERVAPVPAAASRAPAEEQQPGAIQNGGRQDDGRGVLPPPAERAPAGPDRSSAAPEEEAGPRLADAFMQGGPEVAGPRGIVLSLGRQPLTLERVIQSRERNDLAARSERTGHNAAALHPARSVSAELEFGKKPVPLAPDRVASSAPPIPVRPRKEAEIVTGSVAHSGPARQTRQAQAPATPLSPQKLELPPAQIGPLSLRLAAAKGDPAAQLEVAARFAEGKGVRRNLTAAADWYHSAAANGIAVAQYRLAALYERGLGVKKDMGLARQWYERAASKGNVKAMHNLAVMLAGQSGGPPDYANATHWFTQAAERGLADSQFNLAILMESGFGGPRDPVGALKWYSLAAKAGDDDAAGRRDQLIARLPSTGVEAANAAVASWRAKPRDHLANDLKAAGDGWKRRS